MQFERKEKWIIDTDPGIDDMMALIYMLNQRNAEILMIGATDGNVGLDIVTNNLKKILKMNQSKVPIYRGSYHPIVKSYDNSESFHKADGLGEIDEIKQYEANDIPVEKENSSLKIVEYILKYPNEINLLLLGPLTNIAAAYMIEPSICNLVKSVYIMGGSILSRGNLNCTGEFNFAYDFVATKIVLGNFKNVILTAWEPTENLCFKDHHIENLSKSLLAQNKVINEHVHLFCKLLVAKYTKEFTGLQFCDLYSAISVHNRHSVKKFCLCKVDILIDSRNVLGMLLVKSKKNISTDFNTFIDSAEWKQYLQDYVLVIEEFHEEKVILDYEKVLVIRDYMK